MKSLDATASLARLAADFQGENVIPRCGSCRTPCCRLDTLVLELDWRRLSHLWGIPGPRRRFDAALARGEGPPEIRAAEGLYYAYRRVCPGYDERSRRCRVYGDDLKPTGCSDFPLYEEDGCLIADLRCEAVDLEAVEAYLRAGLGPDVRLLRAEDRDFPFLVRLTPRRRTRRRR